MHRMHNRQIVNRQFKFRFSELYVGGTPKASPGGKLSKIFDF